MNDEFLQALKYYFDGTEEVITTESLTSFANEFFSKINDNQIVFRDNPDAYIRFDNFVLIIEHFEYDSTENNKKGSKTRIENERINRKINQSINEKSESRIVNDQLNVSHSTKKLASNFNKMFEHHVNKIEQYKKSLCDNGVIQTNDAVKIMFCCEDKTTFGCLAHDSKYPMYAFSVIDINDCLEKMKKSNVDYFLLLNSYQNQKTVKFIPNNEELLITSMKKSIDEIEMINFTPQVISCSIFIPTSKK